MSLTFDTFKESLNAAAPPDGLSLALQALWYDAKDNWGTAHEYAQQQDDELGAWVHAYLHRKEGDIPNADYWYHRAAKPMSELSLEGEWEAIVQALLNDQ
ncbi:MAG: hypothetical protein GFH27_549309n120 [Chloroflexi bacterium AL-W]|nr:hypothetical protein [Chloroflexi bacterium AL-N1]NOK69822.1 hypothetical protein [Chloroflexi bacterium AL-N10]NOK73574.1 hypothetical protein [Chloroflexi bacterium AL-N5]NOK83992.1 hypothetical protein [Chloroflexi bacterium AL-W]NOK87905.1 hypothetical protein [Chloroflexi bacterium AL-N15]